MRPATRSLRRLAETKVLAIQSSAPTIRHMQFKQFDELLNPGDLLVVNRSGTLPSSFFGIHERSGTKIEIRLASFQGADQTDLSQWYGIAFGSGDWRSPTEDRPLPAHLQAGDRIFIGEDLHILIEGVDVAFNRLVRLKFFSKDLVRNLYAFGNPIQYSYLRESLDV